ncbi:MAG: flippase [Halioglobus sp.]
MEDKKHSDNSPEIIGESTKKQIRGSGLLLSGRLVSLALNLLTQVLIIRYLSKVDYGLFAYTLALVGTFSSVNRLGMERTVARFVPIYQERQDPASAAGTVVLAFAVISALGFAILALAIGFSSFLTETIIENPAVISILLVLIALAPVNAFDNVLEALFSALGKPRIIFLRKYVVAPCLKLAAISLTILIGSNVHTLAIAYVFAGLIGAILYGVLLPKVLREHDFIEFFRPGKFSINSRRLFRFTMPIFTADMLGALRPVLVLAALEYLHGISNVADFRAAVPIARLNGVVLVSFSLLFLPIAARMFAQKNTALLRDMKLHSSLWVTVLSYPVFATCISLSDPLIVLLIGERYSSSAPILAILAVGYFFEAALGLNRQTLRALGKVRVLLQIEVITIVALLILTLLLVPGPGAIGAAVATSASMILYSCINTFMLWRITGSNPLPWLYARVYLIAAVCALGLWLAKSLLGIDSISASLALAGLTSMIVVLSCWRLLRFAEIFPEAPRILKSVKRFLGVST